jgi:hypothetical protein
MTIATNKNTTTTTTNTSSTTTIFTLPSQFINMTRNNNNNAASFYEEFPSPTSPSLPWFVEYWSSSFMNTPLVEQLLCSCNADTTLRTTGVSNMNVASTTTPSFKLRQVVASHTMFEEDEEEDASMMCNNMYTTNPNKTPYFPSICKSSVLMDDMDQDMESILDETMNIVDDKHKQEDDDATRDAAASCSHHGSIMDDYSSRILYTCDSFDQFLRGNKVSNRNVIRLQPRPRQPKYDDDEALMSPSTPPSYRRQQPSQPPSPSATTYTTVSLTQSLLNDDSLFDTEDNSDDEDIGNDTHDFLERWNRNSSKLFRGMDGNEESDGNNPYQTPKATRKRSLLMEPPPHNTNKSWLQNDDKDHTEQYRYLIRMKPHNYMHYSNGCGMEEEKSNEHDIDIVADGSSSSHISSDDFSLPSHHQLSSNMTFHEAFFSKAAMVDATGSPPSLPHMPEW